MLTMASLPPEEAPPPGVRLLPSGALEISVEVPREGDGRDGDVDDALSRGFARIRALSAREVVARLGRDQGYRIEDVEALDAEGVPAAGMARAEAWLKRRLPPRTALRCVASAGPLLDEPLPAWPLRLRARIAARAPESARTYRVEGGRVPVESVELHVVEHCNLRCAQCCNASPYLPESAMSIDEVRRVCARLAEVVRPDVLKIMGGEPLLHPDIGGVLRAVRQSGVAPRVRLFTNGLLLHRLGDDAFAALDELTVSSYASAPVRPEVIAETEARARRFDVVLNVKVVPTFSAVLTAAPQPREAMQAVYDAVFYKCTRAAYHADYHARVAVDARDEAAEQTQRALGVPLDAEDFPARLAAYLSAPEPMASCAHCLGSTGPLLEHVQLRRRDVAAGRLAREAP
jgi:organic radical activating enzyme